MDTKQNFKKPPTVTSKANSQKAKQPTNGQKAKQPANDPKGGSWLGFLFKPYNLLFAFLVYLILTFCNSKVEGYNWVSSVLMKEGLNACKLTQREIEKRERIETNPELRKTIARDTKYEVKLGADYLVLKFIREKTPKDAIILFPSPDILCKPNQFVSLRRDMGLKAFPSYFLYPRKIVYENEKDKNPLFYKAQYVLTFLGWGYQYLDYQMEPRNGIEILPIHQNQLLP